MIINLLLGVLLLLGIVWIALGIAYFWRLFQDLAAQSGKNTPKQKGNGHDTSISTSFHKSRLTMHVTFWWVGVNLSFPRLSPKFPLLPLLRILMKNLILLQRKTHLCPKKQKKRKVQKGTMKCRLTTQWTKLTKTQLSVRNCKSLMRRCLKSHLPPFLQEIYIV